MNPTAQSPSSSESSDRLAYRPLILSGVLLGIGVGGFFDGIVLHQILQWHHMFTHVTSDQTVAGLELNTLGDGLFHLFDWVMTLAGLVCLWRASGRSDVPHSTPVFVGAILIGAGLFNLVEGIIDHHLLQIHHVKPGVHQLAWDLGFLALGAGLVAIGWLLVQKGRSHQGK
ncbi:MAG TPA: DUF2243 domain-containing protein, partial [Thermosynechococcaceae cyanobacterium]